VDRYHRYPSTANSFVPRATLTIASGVEVEIRTPTTSASRSSGGLVATASRSRDQPDHGAERRKGGPKRLHPFGPVTYTDQPGGGPRLHLDARHDRLQPDVLIEGSTIG